MTHHISESIKKASSRVRLLRKVRKYMDTKTASIVYKTMVLPLFTYCSLCLYGATPAYLRQRIDFIESRAERITRSILPKREEVLKRRICIFVHCCLFKHNTCGIFDNYFEFKNHKYATRNNGNQLVIPKIRLEAARASFKFQAVNIFNSLHISLRSEKEFDKFKKAL